MDLILYLKCHPLDYWYNPHVGLFVARIDGTGAQWILPYYSNKCAAQSCSAENQAISQPTI